MSIGSLKSKHPWVVTTPAAVLAAGGLGVSGGLLGQNVVGAAGSGALEVRLGHYTFANDGCSDGDEVDPINVAFVLDGYPHWIRDHAADHGAYVVHDGSVQYFREGTAAEGRIDCRRHDDQSASSCIGCDRFHFRIGTSQTLEGEPIGYAKYGKVSLADAHYENFRWTCPVLNQHSIADDGTSFKFTDINGGSYTVTGGFNRGKEDILKNWVIGGGHPQIEARNWNNRMRFTQCDPIDILPGPDDPEIASSDGFVYYIGTKVFH